MCIPISLNIRINLCQNKCTLRRDLCVLLSHSITTNGGVERAKKGRTSSILTSQWSITQNTTGSTEPVDLEVGELEDGWIWPTCSSCWSSRSWIPSTERIHKPRKHLCTQSQIWNAEPVQHWGLCFSEWTYKQIGSISLFRRWTYYRSVQSYGLRDELTNRSIRSHRLEDKLTNRSV
jgi:hypothetical protein